VRIFLYSRKGNWSPWKTRTGTVDNQRRTRSQLLALAALVILAGGCAAKPSAASGSAAGAVRRTCQQVSAALSDGPDPGADPVGYAEAQILPLRQIHAPDARLSRAISALDAAYRGVSGSDGTSPLAQAAVAAASKQVNAACPGAVS
jgi:hypothetical protein